jgi:hypothetical protein
MSLPLLTSEQAAHPLFAAILKYAREEDRDVAEMERWKLSHAEKKAGLSFSRSKPECY